MWNHIVNRVVTRIVSPPEGHYSQVGRELRTQRKFTYPIRLTNRREDGENSDETSE